MARKRYSDEDVLNLLRQIELSLASGSSIETACRSAGISDATYYNWRKRYGGMGKSQLQELNRARRINGVKRNQPHLRPVHPRQSLSDFPDKKSASHYLPDDWRASWECGVF